ncbi:ATP-binding protein [Gemmata sp. JC717]|uniref:AAA family ATPase n=1 Tax=Gemmata algarum TaxID=2975278 RepID=UPI0021BB4E73|nr:ATP-binding protein [Gemmata algarum]MDY3551057.1 ATP-binding protein [Gemmata algarum]
MVNRLPVRNEYGFQWMITGPNKYQVCGRTAETLPPGAYTVHLDNCGHPNYVGRDLQADELIHFTDSLPAKVQNEIKKFWQTGDRFRRYGYLHRRGYLLYGKQGCGKSSLVNQIIGDIVADGHLAFYCQAPYHFIHCLQKFREVEPERPIVCVFEDIDAIIADHGDSELLQWLDGNHQVDKVVNIATTNYPEKLDRRIISRPRRFDRVLRIEAPDARMREAYLARKVPELTAAELARWVEVTADLPFAALAEVVISVCCMGNDLEESAKLLRSLDDHNPSSAEFANTPPADGAAASLSS